MSDTSDRIERSIEIEAPAQRVWDLVSTPGWWINDGQIVPHEVELDGDVATVHGTEHGPWTVRVVRLEPPRYAAFRWASVPELRGTAQSTLVEFWIEESGGAVRLRVVESGFDALPLPEEVRSANWQDNASGWDTELSAARSDLAGR